ncbi:general secretion pathway protein GspD [Duganella sp. BJB1802]|uniref:secretin N-terminal domain-containing protein n=1 Tax=Duganella sp. BJB1802 TaxID=2744575 RepID=UPI001593D72A|nr:secretin N-terminal domain-containing protein [Duganella sp. BJB1802]NVD69562.1 general secretion pathway protein GspD [Duganella sp. BJB1802]
MTRFPQHSSFRFAAGLVCAALLAGCAAERHHRDGLAAMEARDYPKAVAELVQAAELKPKDVEYRNDWLRGRETATSKLLATAAAAANEGRSAEAEQAYRAILRFDHDNARALAGIESLANSARAADDAAQARAAFKQGDVATASELATRALKSVPGLAEAQAVRRDIDAAQAQAILATPTLGSAYKKPINLEFRDASIKMVFDALSRTTGINFIFDRDVKSDQRTTVFLKQTTLDDAIDVILSTGQLDKKILNASSVLIYPNTPAKTREYQDLMVKAFYLSNVEAKQAANMLKTVLKLKDIYVDDKYNLLVLRENPESIALAEKLIALQDLEEPEVMLDVEVLEINRSRLLNLGIQWTNQFTVTPLAVTTTGGGSSGSGGTGTVGTSSMKLSDLKSLNSSVIGITPPSATISVQKSDGDANLLANPRIRVRDREKAKILIGDKVPVVTTTSSGTFVTENIQYLDVGLKLEVEPDIHLRDEIGLKLALEVSSLVSSVKTNNGSQAYQIGTRNVNTALRLKDGETQILAGLINDEDRSSANRIPLLGDLPVLGRLFGSQNDNRQKTEIVLSITPHLIRNIQRKGAAAESFWSGTEASLRNRPLQLRGFDTTADHGGPGAQRTAAPGAGPAGTNGGGAPAMAPPTSSNAPKLAWSGPPGARVGETVMLMLNLDSPELLRAASLQLAFDPAELEILAVDEGDYFSKGGASTFSKAIDAASGRVSIGAGVSSGAGAKGSGRVLAVTVKARAPGNGNGVSVIAMTPIGGEHSVGRPGLPLTHSLTVTR